MGTRAPTSTRRDPALRARAVKRIFIVAVLIGLIASYVGPVRGYRERQAELRSQEVALKELIAQRDRARVRIREINNPAVLEARARQLGYMKPGEIPFRVTGLDSASGTTGIWDWIANPPGS